MSGVLGWGYATRRSLRVKRVVGGQSFYCCRRHVTAAVDFISHVSYDRPMIVEKVTGPTHKFCACRKPAELVVHEGREIA